MARKRWSAQTEVTDELIKSREKRKWQIALRRYVIEKNSSPQYAPFFGLDIETIRKWFEIQFNDQVSWEDLGRKWQFEHVLPLFLFNSDNEDEMKLCWNFTNLKVGLIKEKKESAQTAGTSVARKYFEALSQHSDYPVCKQMLEKINQIEEESLLDTTQQQTFLRSQHEYLAELVQLDSAAFELLNQGRTLDEARKEISNLKKYTN